MQKEKMEDPKVSVWMITYNHEPFVAQAIESVLMQETDFPVELVIGEDCSTDGTRAICERHARAHPDRIWLLPSERNLGMMGNMVRTLAACRGKYIALCEGDDYWMDPQKLHKQVAWLEQHPQASFCFHPCRVEREGGVGAAPARAEEFRAGEGAELVFPDSRNLAMWCIVHTVSAVVRANMMPRHDEEWMALPAGDWPMFFYLGMQGPFGRLPEPMATYRLHAGGIWNRRSSLEKKQDILTTYRFLRKLGSAVYPAEFRQADVNQLRDYLDDLFWDPQVKLDLQRLLVQGIDRIQSPFFSSRKLSRLALEALYYKTWRAGRREHARAVLAELVARHPAVLLNRHWLRAKWDCMRGGRGLLTRRRRTEDGRQ